MESVKGESSDSFKRACFNFGIGRELYTAPFIWIDPEQCKIEARKNSSGLVCYDRFSVEQILYDEDKKICALSIRNDTQGLRCFCVDYRKKQVRGRENDQ